MEEIQRIQQLPKELISRIAAGEVITRPTQACKELVENALDSNADTIKISIKNGGFDLILIEDNGKGIHPEDFDLAVTRFATSKISQYSDLDEVSTFGFRGEALSSMSYVSKLYIYSRGRACIYVDGALSKELTDEDCPEKGTRICLEELFYNIPSRRIAFSSGSSEYGLIYKLIVAYSIRYARIRFVCRDLTQKSMFASKMGVRENYSSRAEAYTGDGGLLQFDMEEAKTVIRRSFGPEFIGDLISVEETIAMSKYDVKLNCLTSDPGAYIKQTNSRLYIFVNGRLVDMGSLKKQMEQIYQGLIPSGYSFWAIIDIELPGNFIDINVHPSKQIVKFIDEDLIMKEISKLIETNIENNKKTRNYSFNELSVVSKKPLDKPASNKPKIRTDPSQIKLSHFTTPMVGQGEGKMLMQSLKLAVESQASSKDLMFSDKAMQKRIKYLNDPDTVKKKTTFLFPFGRNEAENNDGPFLESIYKELVQRETIRTTDEDITFWKQSVFVGALNARQAFIQSGEDLFVVHIQEMAQFLVEYSILYRIGQMPKMHVGQINLVDLLADESRKMTEAHLTSHCPQWLDILKDHYYIETEKIVDILNGNAELLNIYFSIYIENGILMTLPRCSTMSFYNGACCITPLIIHLYIILQSDDEAEVLSSIVETISRWYICPPPIFWPNDNDEKSGQRHVLWNINTYSEQFLYKLVTNAVKQYNIPVDSASIAIPPVWLTGNLPKISFSLGKYSNKQGKGPCNMSNVGIYRSVARLTDLYKVFERC